MIIELNDKNYNTLINNENSKESMVFIFSSEWCTYCKNLLKKINIIEKDKNKPCEFKIYYIQEHNSRKILNKFSIKAYPTIIFFKNNKMFNYFEGNISMEILVENFKKLCKKNKKRFFFF